MRTRSSPGPMAHGSAWRIAGGAARRQGIENAASDVRPVVSQFEILSAGITADLLRERCRRAALGADAAGVADQVVAARRTSAPGVPVRELLAKHLDVN